MMFGQNVSVAAQDPSYPVYVDSSVIMGMTGGYNPSTNAFDGLEYMTCRPENDFFPDLSRVSQHESKLAAACQFRLTETILRTRQKYSA